MPGAVLLHACYSVLGATPRAGNAVTSEGAADKAQPAGAPPDVMEEAEQGQRRGRWRGWSWDGIGKWVARAPPIPVPASYGGGRKMYALSAPAAAAGARWPFTRRYTPAAARACLAGRHVLLLGDSRTRYQFLDLAAFYRAAPHLQNEHEWEELGQFEGFYDGVTTRFEGRLCCDCSRINQSEVTAPGADKELGTDREFDPNTTRSTVRDNEYYRRGSMRVSFMFLTRPGGGYRGAAVTPLRWGGLLPRAAAAWRGSAAPPTDVMFGGGWPASWQHRNDTVDATLDALERLAPAGARVWGTYTPPRTRLRKGRWASLDRWTALEGLRSQVVRDVPLGAHGKVKLGASKCKSKQVCPPRPKKGGRIADPDAVYSALADIYIDRLHLQPWVNREMNHWLLSALGC
eukprot:gene23399-48404_t